MDEEKLERLRKRIMEEMEGQTRLDDKAASEVIDRCMSQEYAPGTLSFRKRMVIHQEIFNALRRYDILTEPLSNPEVTEIMVNGPDNIFLEKKGHIEKSDRCFRNREVLENLVQHIVAGVNRQINEANPVVDARLPDGSRVHAILPPVAIDGPVISIRKFAQSKLSMNSLVAMGSISREAAEFLRQLVAARYNIFICGGTGSGKTTMLNSLSEYIDCGERIITIEDSAELQITACENLVRLETRNASREGVSAVTIRDLIRSALRMRPDRLIVGEVRGDETIDMLQAFNTGHDGSLSTGHANSPADMLKRLETMVLMGMDIPLAAVRGQISSAIEIMVHVSRLRDGSRRVMEIDEVLGMENGEIPIRALYRFVEKGEADGRIIGELEATGAELSRREKLIRSGLLKG